MSFIIGLLTVVMVLNCLVLILLVLIQLPKKEAGLGMAFGSGATDALFGAGSGNVLTKITKYSAGIFFGMAVVLSLMQSHYHRRPGSEFQRELQKQTQQAGGISLPPVAPAPGTAPTAGTNLPALPSASATNPPSTTNPPAEVPVTPFAPAPATSPAPK